MIRLNRRISDLKTSIIILTYNQLNVTKLCIESILKHTPENIEIIVVDNHSTDGTIEYLQSLSYIRTIFNETNQGFARGCNQGYEIASGDTILFLNNDTVVTKNWLHNMLNTLYQDDQIGIVGPVSNYVGGSPQQIQAGYSSIDSLDSFAEQYSNQTYRNSKRTLRLVGFCLLIKRKVLEDIGSFDENFKTGSFEDDDLCIRAIKNGYHLRIAEDSFIHHHGHATFNGNQELSLHHSFVENKHYIMQKWSIDTAPLFYPKLEVIDLLPTDAKKILHIGCGAGATGIEVMNRQDCELYGVESNPLLAEIATGSYTEVRPEILKETYPERFFDAIVCDGLDYPNTTTPHLKSFISCLKDKGVIICNHHILDTVNDQFELDYQGTDFIRIIKTRITIS